MQMIHFGYICLSYLARKSTRTQN